MSTSGSLKAYGFCWVSCPFQLFSCPWPVQREIWTEIWGKHVSRHEISLHIYKLLTLFHNSCEFISQFFVNLCIHYDEIAGGETAQIPWIRLEFFFRNPLHSSIMSAYAAAAGVLACMASVSAKLAFSHKEAVKFAGLLEIQHADVSKWKKRNYKW